MPDYNFSELTLDELTTIQRNINGLINKLTDRDRVTLFMVEDSLGEQFFHLDFQDAKSKLCECIMSDEFTPDCVQDMFPRLHTLRVYPDEAERYLKTN